MSFVIASGAARRCPDCGEPRRVLRDVDIYGRLVESVEPCRCAIRKARRLACICQRCDRPVVGKPKVALYCERHRKAKRAEVMRRYQENSGGASWRAYRARNREALAAKARLSYRADDAERERRNEYKRQWRKANRDKVRAQKRRAALRRGGKTPESISRWREEVAAGLRTPKRAPRNERGQRLCLTPGCRKIMSGRAKLCAACKAAGAEPRRERAA